METLAPPKHGLSNIQLELLKIFSRNIREDDLLAIRVLIAQYLAKKASAWADKIMEEKGLDIDTILHTHIRTPYR